MVTDDLTQYHCLTCACWRRDAERKSGGLDGAGQQRTARVNVRSTCGQRTQRERSVAATV